MRTIKYIVCSIIVLLFSDISNAEIVSNIQAEGACAIVGMTAEQCQLTALQRARAAAIEQAAGMSVSSSTLVTNMALTAEFIKSYSKGFIVKEKVEWPTPGQYQKDPSTPALIEYRVKITADVKLPEPKIKPIGIRASTNAIVYKNGDKAVIEVSADRESKIGIFNITADDKVFMVFPNEHDKDNKASKAKKLVFPGKNARSELEMQTLEGHKRDAEAFFIVGLDGDHARDFIGMFKPSQSMSFSDFFRKYSEIADYAEDVILTYEVINSKDK
ncbi:MAG: DUF4384 domain-containing protein [Nitrospirae bacterium]|nr:DUF4384 domain-containing protein [Nitrospirota bacterium]